MAFINSKQHFLEVNCPHNYDMSTFWNQLRNVVDIYTQKQNGLYALIVHDKDVKETGEAKTSHMHIYLEYPSRVKTIALISDFADLFDDLYSVKWVGDFTNCFRDQRVLSKMGALKYLVHRKNEEKHQYDVEDVYSNKFQYVKDIIDSADYEAIDTEHLIGFVKSCDMYDTIRYIGIDNARIYWSVIQQLYKLKDAGLIPYVKEEKND